MICTTKHFLQIRYAVLVLCALAVVVHLIAFAFPFDDIQRLEVLYIRNIILSAAMACAIVQLLEFLRYAFYTYLIIYLFFFEGF